MATNDDSPHWAPRADNFRIHHAFTQDNSVNSVPSSPPSSRHGSVQFRPLSKGYNVLVGYALSDPGGAHEQTHDEMRLAAARLRLCELSCAGAVHIGVSRTTMGRTLAECMNG